MRATECPLPPSVEVVLRALAQGEGAEPLDLQALAMLRLGGFAAEPADELHVITDLGLAYLTARSDQRFPTCVEVLGVDKARRFAQVAIGAWHSGRPVLVLLEYLMRVTGLTAEELPGVWLDADVNALAEDPDDLVLTQVRVPPPVDETVCLRVITPVGGVRS
ncbi:hypothetical protein [Streptomyces sp. AD55]|uniref:hypothetical protein n=1 Tax=Streptomyces sp. AD55 TaxID=3242895 RepID=UPI00352829A1